MKFIDSLYINIYAWYNKMKTSGRNVNPLIMTAFMFGLCLQGWELLFNFLFYRFVKNTSLVPKYYVYIFSICELIFAGLINEFYTSKDRYLNLYNEYTSLIEKKNRNKRIALAFVFIFLPYIIYIPAIL